MDALNPPIERPLARAIAQMGLKSDVLVVAVVPLPGGQINSTAMLVTDIGDRYVLRVAPDPAVAAMGPSWLSPFGLRRELVLIEEASDLAPLLPTTVAYDFEHTLLPRDWVLQQVMPGVPLATLTDQMDDDTATTIWHEVGAFTKALHDHGGMGFGPPAWGPSFTTWTELLRSDVEGLIDDAGRFGLPTEPFFVLRRLIEDAAPLLDTVRPALIHSDLNPAHIFVTDDDADGTLHIGGVIDLEYGRHADPLSEHLLLNAIPGHLPHPASEAFLDGYGGWAASPDDEVRSRIASAMGIAWDTTLKAAQGGDIHSTLSSLQRVVNSERLGT